MQTQPTEPRATCPHLYESRVIIACPFCAGSPGYTSYRRQKPSGGRRSTRLPQRRVC